jgi:hypothetical protein
MSETPTTDYAVLLHEMGRLVLTWNDLDWTIRNIIFFLAMDDAVSVMILTADMNTAAALNALRALAAERDALEARNVQSPQAIKVFGRREVQPILDNVKHFIEYTDRLREYRNFYVHGIRSPQEDKGIWARTISARGRYSMHEQPVTVADLRSLSDRIAHCIGYGIRLSHALAAAYSYLHFSNSAAEPPTWPEKPPLPDRLVKNRQVLLGRQDQPPPSQE